MSNKPNQTTVDQIAIKAAHGHPDYPVTGSDVDFLLEEIERLRALMTEAADAIEDEDHAAALVLLRAGKPRLKP